jgi:hypothetical protein
VEVDVSGIKAQEGYVHTVGLPEAAVRRDRKFLGVTTAAPQAPSMSHVQALQLAVPDTHAATLYNSPRDSHARMGNR